MNPERLYYSVIILSTSCSVVRQYHIQQEYTKNFDELESRKKSLQAAEQLFDNALADFSNFNRAKTDFGYMELIYKIYKAQKNARDIWSKTLWSNLNPQALVDGIEQFFKEFRWKLF